MSIKSSVQNSRSVTPESMSIELSDSEITDNSSKLEPKYSILIFNYYINKTSVV